MSPPIIYIKSSGPTPTPLTIPPGGQVTFQMQDWPVVVTIDFGSNSPFTDPSFQLNGGNQQLSSSTKTALSSASGKYVYSVTPTTQMRLPDEKPDQASAPAGEIDVSSGY